MHVRAAPSGGVVSHYCTINTIQYNTISNLYSAAIYNLPRSANKKDSVNKNDFKCRLKALVSVIVRRCGGREFHAAGPDSRVAEATLAELASRSCSALYQTISVVW